MINIFLKILNISLSASLLIAACIIIRYAFKSMPKYMRCLLWMLVLIRLACPIRLESSFSFLPRKDITVDLQEVSSREELSTGSDVKAYRIKDSTLNGKVKTYILTDSSSGKNISVKEVRNEESIVSGNDSSRNIINKANVILLLTVIWIIGIICSLINGIVSYIKILRCVDDAVLLKDNVYQSDRVATPFVLGIFRTKIYIPFNLTKKELYFVLSHERAHISRKDHMLKPVAYLISCIYWFNPLVWISYMLLCRDIELACDEKAIRRIGYNNKKEYSQSILDLSVPRRLISACPVAFGETGVKERVKSVLNMKKGTKIAAIISALLIVIVGVGFLTYPKTKKNKTKESTTGFVTESTTEPDLGLPTEAKKEETTEETEKAKTNKSSDKKTETEKASTDDKKTEQKSEEQKSDNASDGENLPYTAEIDSIKEIIKSVVQDDGAAYDGSDVKVVFVRQTADGEYTSDITPDVDYSLEINKDVDGNENAIIVYTQAMGDIVATDTEGTEVDDEYSYESSGEEVEEDDSYEIVEVPVEVLTPESFSGDDNEEYTDEPYIDDNRVGGINVKEGSDIRSFSGGTVKTVGSNEENGNYIVITGDDGNIYSYFNLKDLPTLKEGEKIKEAQQLGKAAGIGDAEKPYFEIQVVDKKGVTKNIKIFTQNYYYYD